MDARYRLSLLFIFMLTLLQSSGAAWGARRALKKRADAPSIWYGSTDVTYSNWLKDKWEGGGESRMAGLQFGLNLPWSVSTFIRFSAMPDPDGFQDIRTGLSKSFMPSDSVRSTLSSSFSVPTSEYSRSIQQKTQASLASTLEFFMGGATLSLTGYGAKAYYRNDGAIPPSETLQLAKGGNSGKPKKPHPSTVAPIASDILNPDDQIEINYSDVIYMTRFDYLWGGAMDLTWRFNSEWAVNTAGSITRSTFTTDESVWSCDVTLLQATYSYKLVSIFAGTGLLDSGTVLHWPGFKTYTVGTSYILPN